MGNVSRRPSSLGSFRPHPLNSPATMEMKQYLALPPGARNSLRLRKNISNSTARTKLIKYSSALDIGYYMVDSLNNAAKN